MAQGEGSEFKALVPKKKKKKNQKGLVCGPISKACTLESEISGFKS
jgi:hypothetical protein